MGFVSNNEIIKMKAEVHYNDLKGTVAADISDIISETDRDDLASIGKYFKLNQSRFKIVGISIYGTDDFYISLVCKDKQKSRPDKEHIVSMFCDIKDEKTILKILFKRFHILLFDKFDEKYPKLKFDEEVRFSDFHDIEGEK